MKRHVAISTAIEGQGFIAFYANDLIAAKMSDFGQLRAGQADAYYHLCVDPRYDFADVLAYLESMA